MRWWKEADLRWKIFETQRRMRELIKRENVADLQVRILRASLWQEVAEYQWSYFEERPWRMKEVERRVGASEAVKVVLDRALIQCYQTELERSN